MEYLMRLCGESRINSYLDCENDIRMERNHKNDGHNIYILKSSIKLFAHIQRHSNKSLSHSIMLSKSTKLFDDWEFSNR